MTPIDEIWRKVLLRNPLLAVGIRDAVVEANLTPEERKVIDATLLSSTVSVGKFSKAVYGSPTDSFNEAVEREHKQSLANQQDVIRAYNKDVVGSYNQAEKNAYSNSFFNPANNRDPRDNFITKVRGIAQSTFESQRKDELNALSKRYNIDRNKVSDATAGDIGLLDTPTTAPNMPERISYGIARDIGKNFGELQNTYASGVAGVLGEHSPLTRGIDNTTRFAGALKDDIIPIITASPWMTKGINKIKEQGAKIKDLAQVNGFLDGLHNVHSQWLRNLVNEFADVLDAWYHDPRTLCCFIKNIAAWATASNANFKEIQTKYFHGQVKWSELTGVRVFFDKLIAILKIIREFLKQDIGFTFMLSLDIGLAMSKASLGALVAALMALQQMLEDTIYAELLKIVNKNIREEWRQCFPFERLLRIIADFLSGPDGLFKYIEQYIDSFLNTFSANMHNAFNASKKQKLLDITAIDKLIALLEAIRDALLNLELCIEADFSETSNISDDASRSEKTVGVGSRNYPELINKIRRQDEKTNIKPNLLSKKVIFPTDNEIKTFITNRLGESEAFADQVILTANRSSDSGQVTGSNSKDTRGLGAFADQLQSAIGDCARTLDSNKILELANLMSDWEIGV